MPASDNSIRAYGAHILAGKATGQRARILALLASAARPMSRKEIAKYFAFPAQDGGPEIPLASVCGRVNSMLPDPAKDKPGLVCVHHKEPDPKTGHPVDYLTPVNGRTQLGFSFGFAPRVALPVTAQAFAAVVHEEAQDGTRS